MKIAIVNDVPLAAEALRRVVLGAPEHSLAWIARDGAQAVEACARDTPDLILMDLIMPVMDGIEATRRIMAENPCAILVVTASVNGNHAKVFEALGAGAIDLVQTPPLGGAGKGGALLLYKIETIAKQLGKSTAASPPPAPEQSDDSSPPPAVVIGASAGGPAALAEIFAALPADFPAGLVVVQHVDPQFVPGLTQWLGRTSPLTIRVAEEGDSLQAGHVLVASGTDHLVFRNGRTLGYVSEPASIYRPSIDVFFESVARHLRGSIAGLLLTGMGRDGAAGLKRLRECGHHTIGQDRATCAVYGMPKAAAELGAICEVLPLSNIPHALLRRFSETPAGCPQP